jgi:hypothetical protein
LIETFSAHLLLQILIIPLAVKGVKQRITEGAIMMNFEKVKTAVKAIFYGSWIIILATVIFIKIKGYLKPFKGYVSTIFRKSQTYIFLIFQPFEAGRIYA